MQNIQSIAVQGMGDLYFHPLDVGLIGVIAGDDQQACHGCGENPKDRHEFHRLSVCNMPLLY